MPKSQPPPRKGHQDEEDATATTPSEEAELRNKHQQLVNELNLDEETASHAWNSFKTIRQHYTLQGDDLHWLGCAVFVACRLTVTPTLSKGVVKGNPVSLTSLLRLCDLSLKHFFNKIHRWVSMAGLNKNEGDELNHKIKKLEEEFSVTCNIHKEFMPMFKKVFKVPEVESAKHRNRKQKPLLCTPLKVFEFTWLLFLAIKRKHSTCSNLIECLHFLMSCCDLSFKNAYLADRRDLINPLFQGLPSNWHSVGFNLKFEEEEVPCVVKALCEKDILPDALYVKEYQFKEYVEDFFREEILNGNVDSFTGLFDVDNFESNYSNLTKWYEQHILNEGGFDEKIFLAEYQRQLLLKNAINGNSTPVNYLGESNFDQIRTGSTNGEAMQCPPTPLTGRNYLGPRENRGTTVVENISRLRSSLAGRGKEPSPVLVAMFLYNESRAEEIIREVLNTLGNNKFIQAFAVDHVPSEEDQQKLDLSVVLFYKLLENILKHERNINKNLAPLLEKKVFYECLYTCSVEIVLHCFNVPRPFPWVLDVLEIPTSNFVRVIELIVRSKDDLSRDTVKHLNYIEECILESLIWKADSPFWDELAKWGDDFPKFEEIALPGTIVQNNTTGGAGVANNPTVRSLFPQGSMQAPGPSATETFQSPVSSHAKKQLFSNVKPGQSVLQSNHVATHLMLTDSEGKQKLIPLELQSPIQPERKPKKSGSPCIILRKFYNLAAVRMEDLCQKLEIRDVTEVADLKRRIWTVFEYSVKVLLKNRHLDQLLMCAVYVICRLSGVERKFCEIMKCYRTQPQCNSDVYRSVFMIKLPASEDGSLPERESRSNLINFYNSIYIEEMRNCLSRFRTQNGTQLNDDELLLSPLPSKRSSPRHQITRNIFITSYDSPTNTNPAGEGAMVYCFSRSASQELKDINKAINGGSILGKRLLSDDDGGGGVTIKRTAQRRFQTLIEERKVQNQ